MTVAFDATFLIPLLDAKAPETLPGTRRRISYLVGMILSET
jgi:hypothetical protein